MKIDIRDKNTLTVMVSTLVAVPTSLLLITFLKNPQDSNFYLQIGFMVSIFILFCLSVAQNHFEQQRAIKENTLEFQKQNHLLAQEVTRRQQTQKQLEYNETRLRTILNTVQTCIVIIDSKTHEIIDVNPAASKAIGAMKEDLIGKKCYNYICPEQRDSCPVTDGKVIYEAERMILKNDRTQIPVIKTITAVKLGGRDCLLESFIDISEQKRVEEQLQKAKDCAEASLEAKSQFLANMSHEIRTPMNAIIGFGSLLLDEELNETQKNYVDIIYSSSKNLLTIINDILDFSKIEAGKMTIEMKNCDLKSMLNELYYMMQPITNQKKIGYKVNIGEDMPDVIVSDIGRLRQCLINLINNAVKFTDKGHVHVNTDLKQIGEDTFVYFDVEDTGIGIADERQEDIFKSFTQADGTTCRQYGGTGLGLTITKQLARLLGGDLILKSTLGKGSTFTLLTPAKIPVETIKKSTDEIHRKHTTHESNSYIALVAEDSFTNQTLIRILLDKEGFDAEIAKNGKEAVELAKENDYDIILMDMHMPMMNGDEAARLIVESGNKTPIVALTADTKEDAEQMGMTKWCDGFLNKPVDREKLAKILEQFVTQKTT